MGAMTATMVGLGVASAGMQVWSGMQAKDEAEANAVAIQQQSEYNAGVYEQQAGMIEKQKQLKAQQDNRLIRFAAGKHTAVTAGKGLEMSGSALAVLNDTITQLEMDKAIGQYNLDVKKYGVLSQAEGERRQGATMAAQYRRKGGNALFAGIVGGLSTLYQTGAYAHTRMYSPKRIDTSGGAKYGGKA